MAGIFRKVYTKQRRRESKTGHDAGVGAVSFFCFSLLEIFQFQNSRFSKVDLDVLDGFLELGERRADAVVGEVGSLVLAQPCA